MAENTVTSEVQAKDICGEIGGLHIKDVFQLGDGRMEVTWEATDLAIHDELAYLASVTDMPVSRTSAQAKQRNDLIHYLFNNENKWYGIRCPKSVWMLFMKSKDIPDTTVDSFISAWTKSPVKQLIEKELVDAVRGIHQLTGME